MKARLAFGVLWLASARLITQDEDASGATVLLQRAVEHFGSATVDVSADGQFVAFESAAALVPADRNRSVDIYVLDRSTGHVTLESVVTNATVGDGTRSSSTEWGRPVPGIHVVRAPPRRPADGSRPFHRSSFGIDGPARPRSCLALSPAPQPTGSAGMRTSATMAERSCSNRRRPISLMKRIETVRGQTSTRSMFVRTESSV